MNAPIVRRLLALFVDGLVLRCFVQLGFMVSFDYGFVLTFFLAAVYFSCGYSEITEGATLGKRLFGLSVRDTQSGKHPCLKHGFYRFLSSFGIIILCVEIPPIVYRSLSLSGPLAFLELPMLFALLFFFGSIALFLIHPDRRGLHDYLASSMVVENNHVPDHWTPREKVKLSALTALGALVALPLWLYGISYPQNIEPLVMRRYLLEQEFNLRGLSFTPSGDEVSIQGIALSKLSPEIRKSISYRAFELSPSIAVIELDLIEFTEDGPVWDEEPHRFERNKLGAQQGVS